MRRFWLSLLFLFGGVSHELRHPLNCECIVSRARGEAKRPGRLVG